MQQAKQNRTEQSGSKVESKVTVTHGKSAARVEPGLDRPGSHQPLHHVESITPFLPLLGLSALLADDPPLQLARQRLGNSPDLLLDDLLVTLYNLLQRVPHVGGEFVVNLHLVGGLKTGLFSKLLTPRRQVPSEQVFLEFGVFPYVEEDDDVGVRIRIPIFSRQFHITRDDEVALDKLDPVHLDLIRLGVRLDLVRRQLGQAILDPTQVFPELLAQGGPVGRRLVLDPDLFFVRGQGHAKDVQLFLDVSFEGLDVLEVLGVVMEDDDLLQGLARSLDAVSLPSCVISGSKAGTDLLDGQLFPIPQQPRQIDDRLHPLDLPLDSLVKVLFPDLGEHAEMHRTHVLVPVLRGRGEGQERVVQVLRGERCERAQGQGQGVEGLEQRVQGRHGVLVTTVTLESVSVESDVPVRQFGDQVQQSRYDRVQSVG